MRRRRLFARGHEYEKNVGLGVLSALHEGHEIRVFERDSHRADDRAARLGKALRERFFAVVAWRVVADQRIGLFHALLRRPLAERVA